jgi:hypothetical protein
MMNADVSFLVREALTVWTALTSYHNAGHQHRVVIGVYLWRFLISVHLR